MLSTKARFQMVSLEHWSPSMLLPVPIEVLFFCCALVVWGLLEGGCWVDGGISPSLDLLVYFPLFLFFSGAFATEDWGGAGVGGEVWPRLQDTPPPPAWAMSKANKLGVFSLSTIAFGTLMASWLELTYTATKWWWLGLEGSSKSA